MVDEKMMESPTASPEVLASTGTEVTGERVERSPTGSVESGEVCEGHFDLNPSPRNLTRREAGIYLPSFVREFGLRRPDVKVEYADVRSAPGSPEVQRLVVQFSTHSPALPIVPIIAAIIAVGAAAAVIALVGVVVAPGLKTVYDVVTKPVPPGIRYLVYLIPLGIIGFLSYKFVVKPLLRRRTRR